MMLASANPALPAGSRQHRPCVRAPREGAAVVAAVVAVVAVFMWAAGLTVFINDLPLAGFVLGIAMVTTNGALGIVGWCNLRKAIAVLDNKIDELSDDHKRIVAEQESWRNTARQLRINELMERANEMDDNNVTSLNHWRER